MQFTCRLEITVRGVVQGVGFRPFVYNTAKQIGLSGWVRNEADTVHIEVQGARATLDRFLEALRRAAPPQARIDAIDVAEIAVVESPATGEPAVFQILPSGSQASPRPTIPADLPTCRDCLAEINDSHQRRYRYPFTNCTNCGPRWSIIQQLPYDRARTSMAAFAMCPDCRAEYDNPADRRFHAQPIACPRCGPVLKLLDSQGQPVAGGDEALSTAAETLLAGHIVALKGLGGFQLLVDATNAEAVARLRRRKHRPDRPFAIMLPSLDAARQWCDVSDAEAEVLESHYAPIVLLRRKKVSDAKAYLVEGVAPGNPYLGVMLPYTPLHHLLMQAVARPIVCTSGNLSDEPMAITSEDALQRLGPIADVLLTHNRPIERPVDDSIVRVSAAGLQVLRRARGFAPLPLKIAGCRSGRAMPTVLAVGGHLKNTVALCLGGDSDAPPSAGGNSSSYDNLALHSEREPVTRAHEKCAQVVMSAHIGDLDSVLSVEVFRRAIDDLVEFFQAKPDVVVCDLHPDYASTRRAEALAVRWDVPLLRVQHHHAHVAACAAEHGLTGPVLGFSWDGTGYGLDATVWGGEALLCDGTGFRRVAHLRTFSLPGGDRAVRQPRRSAFGILHEILGKQAAEYAQAWFTATELELLDRMLARNLHSPRTSSMGRLFDAVAAMCGLPAVISFEGQAAMALEYAADESEDGAYAFTVIRRERSTIGEEPLAIDWEPVVRAVLADRAGGMPIGRISARFHNGLADMAVAVARAVGCPQVALTGGCFQNAVLAGRVRQRLLAAGFRAYNHKRVPPGDGGIALGQVALSIQQW